MKAIYKIAFFLLVSLISCEPDNERIKNKQVAIDELKVEFDRYDGNTAFVKVTFKTPKANSTIPDVFYRKEGETEWHTLRVPSGNSGVFSMEIQNLEKEKTYFLKTSVTLNGNKTESPEISFITTINSDDITISVLNVEFDGIVDNKANVKATLTTTKPLNLVPAILYKKDGGTEWIALDVTAGSNGVFNAVIPNLEVVKKYFVKTTVTLNDKLTESKEISFKTKLFTNEATIEQSAYDPITDGVFNRKCNVIYNYMSGATFDKTKIEAYIKVGKDSLKMKSLVFSDETSSGGYVTFNFPDNVQFFFDKDVDYNFCKEYAISVTYGDYNFVINKSNKFNHNPFLEEIAPKKAGMSIYNKIPRIVNYYTPNYLECIGNGNKKSYGWKVALLGAFWGDYFTTLVEEPLNKSKDYEIILTSVANPSVQKKYLKKDYKANYDWNSICGGAMSDFTKNPDATDDKNFRVFHQHNHLWLVIPEDNTITAGEYNVQVKFTGTDDVVYTSNIFKITLSKPTP